jgi:flagellar protein FliJ
MNRFRFRLESVLKVRKAEETNKKTEFGAALHIVKKEEDRLREIVDDIGENDRNLEERSRGRTNSAELMELQRYAGALERKKTSQEDTIARAEDFLSLKRNELVESTRRKKTLERLRERALREHERAALLEEQAVIDEVAVQKHASSRDTV